MRARAMGRFIGVAFVLGTVLALAARAWAAEDGTSPRREQARQIRDATDVKGGLIVHLGCGDGKLTAALRAGDGYLIHGLDPNAANVEKARKHIRALGLYGMVSVDRWSGRRLPYIDNLVNLLVSERPMQVRRDEVLRVLAPGGVAYVRKDGQWTKTVKPWPEEIDQWTHFLHDATGNAVAKDRRVGPPRQMQWMAEPTWCRNHHTLASISAVVSAQGRVFYVVDEGPAASLEVPPKWFVVARDAFNGVLLWKRPIRSWAWHRRKFRSGPVQLPRTLVAGAGRVYVPLGIGASLSALDAATGELIGTFGGTEGTEEVILDEGVLFVVTGSPVAEQAAIGPQRSPTARFPNQKSIVAIRAETEDMLWKWSESSAANLVPLTLAAAGQRVLFAAGKGVVCLDRNTGRQLWNASPAGAGQPGRKVGQQRKPAVKQKSSRQRAVGWSVATLVVQDGVVLWADGKRLSALSAEAGRALWDCPCKPGFRSPVDVLVAGGLVWLGPDFSAGRDLRTGEVKKSNATVENLWTVGHHHRCYREKATDRYIMTGKRGIEFLDLLSDNHSRNNWVRGVCQYGIMPCNGLIYAPSHACGCFMEAKLYGFWALAPGTKGEGGRGKAEGVRESHVKGMAHQDARLERGPAFGEITRPPSALPLPPLDDWPTHRHDPLRSGSTTIEVPLPLRDIWRASIGGRLSAPVVAEGTVVVSPIDAHRVVALDAHDGETRWAFTAGGRVDSPPTLYRGLVLFGCADGWVYCLRLSDGEQVWRFRAAPEHLKTVALDQVESVWPVHGSVLVQHGIAYVAAGRSSYLDGGIFLYGLDPMTGKTVCRTRVRSSHPKAGDAASGENGPRIETARIGQNATDYKTFTAPDRSDAFSMDGATTDILVGDATAIYMRHLRFDRNCVKQETKGRHLFSTSRLLDDAEVHRSHWVLGTGDFRRIHVAYSWIAHNPNRYGTRLAVPYGLMLAFDHQTIWGVRRGRTGGYLLFAEANTPFSVDEQPLPDFRPADPKNTRKWKWSVQLPMRPRALLRAGKFLFLGGTRSPAYQTDLSAAFEGRKGGLLYAVSATDGQKLAEYKLDSPPVFDGLAGANHRLYLSTLDGKVLCLGRP